MDENKIPFSLFFVDNFFYHLLGCEADVEGEGVGAAVGVREIGEGRGA